MYIYIFFEKQKKLINVKKEKNDKKNYDSRLCIRGVHGLGRLGLRKNNN